MKKNKLRQDFGNETGQTIRQEAYITFNKEYVEWLEDKLIKALTIPVVIRRVLKNIPQCDFYKKGVNNCDNNCKYKSYQNCG